MPTLTLYFGEDFGDDNWAGLPYQLDCPGGHKNGGEWLLGRDPTSDLTINIRNVSRRHAAISYSYASDRWSLQDLGSSEGTFINGKKLAPGDPHPLKIGDRFYLGPNRINVVEDEQDTIGDHGPPTIASTEPLDYRPAADPPAPPAPPPTKTYADSLYYAVEWIFSGRTMAGKVYRVAVASGVVTLAVVVFEAVR